MQDKKTFNFVKFIDNIWYHYKYVILLLVAVAIMLSVVTYQSVIKKDPDVFIYYISTEGLTVTSKDNFIKSMSLIAKDYNGDGAVTVELKDEMYVPASTEQYIQGGLSVTESFNLELALGECIIYIMDESFYNGNKQYMADIESLIGYLPDSAVNEKAVMLSELPAYIKMSGLRDLPAESYVCVRERRSGMNEEAYNAHVDYFKNLVEFVDYNLAVT